MTKRRAISLFGILLLVAAAGVAAALLLTNRREATTSSEAAYRLWREAIDNERRFYMKEARTGFAKALELDPDFAAAMLGLARQSEKEQALSLLHRAERLKSRLTERERLHVDLGLAAWEKGPAERLKIAREILRRYPDDFRATTIVAMEEVQNGRMEEAVRLFTRLLEADPNSADAYNQIGYYYGYRGEYERAIENLKKYQFMAPDQANPHDSLGEIQAYSGHYDEAIQNLNRALSVKPDFFASYDHLGVVYEGRGDYARARDHFLRAAELSPLMKEGYLFKAIRVTMEAGDRDMFRSIAERFEKLPKSEYSDVNAEFLRACERMIEGRPADAEHLLAELRPKAEAIFLKRNRTAGRKFYEPGWNYLMARALIAQGRESEALPLLEEMASPPNPWEGFEGRQMVYDGRAQFAALLAKRGDLDRAEKLLEENKRWNPSWAPTRPAETTVAELRRARVLASAK